METALYGGSFNPLHIGHLAILRKLADSFERIYLVVSPKNPLKDNIAEFKQQVHEAYSLEMRDKAGLREQLKLLKPCSDILNSVTAAAAAA